MKEKRNYLSSLQDQNCHKEMREKPIINEKTKKILENREEFKKNILDRISNYISEEREKKKMNEEIREKQLT